MSRTNRAPKREPAERPFPYQPRAVAVTVQPAGRAPHIPTRQPDPLAELADRAT